MGRLVGVPVSLVTVCLVAAWSPSANEANRAGSGTYAEDGTFTMAINLALDNWDPHAAGGLGPTGLAYLVYDPLVQQLPSGEFVPGLAEEWTVDASSATFTLRPDVTCSDGTRLTADVVADSINWNMDPTRSWLYGFYTPTVPLTATGDNASGTVEVVTEERYGFLLHTIGQLPIVCANGMADREILETGSDGTGPFVLTEVVPGQSYTLTRRDDYTWGPDGVSTSEPGTPATVVVRVITEETTAANLLLSGELNAAQVTGPDRERLDAAGLERIDWQSGGAWLTFNQQEGRVTTDRRVREALLRAVDFDDLITISTGATGGAATGLLPLEPKVCEGDNVTGQVPDHDTATAEALLDEAGWAEGSDGIRRKGDTRLTIDLVHLTTSPLDTATAEFLAQQWGTLGVQVNVPGYNETKFAEVLYTTSNWDVYLGAWEFLLPSQMVPYLSGPVPPEGTNVAYILDEEYDELAAKAVTMTAPEACTYWNQAEQVIISNLYIVPISTRVAPWFLQGAEARFQYLGPTPTSIRVLD